jgi:hypothetical protein
VLIGRLPKRSHFGRDFGVPKAKTPSVEYLAENCLAEGRRRRGFGAIDDARRAKISVAFAAAASPEVHAAPVPGRVRNFEHASPHASQLIAVVSATRKKLRAMLLGDRIDTSGLEQTDVLAAAPLTFRAGKDGVVILFRYGVVVLLFDLGWIAPSNLHCADLIYSCP